ncbi:hypothetical protein DFH27DRAFT_529461 [Peziza echinospora]|nr:hypothetical protein DFH27DRAFT_529461 [Peziza echinospora]
MPVPASPVSPPSSHPSTPNTDEGTAYFWTPRLDEIRKYSIPPLPSRHMSKAHLVTILNLTAARWTALYTLVASGSTILTNVLMLHKAAVRASHGTDMAVKQAWRKFLVRGWGTGLTTLLTEDNYDAARDEEEDDDAISSEAFLRMLGGFHFAPPLAATTATPTAKQLRALHPPYDTVCQAQQAHHTHEQHTSRSTGAVRCKPAIPLALAAALNPTNLKSVLDALGVVYKDNIQDEL